MRRPTCALSHKTVEAIAELTSAWGRLDGGWHSYCREDAEGYYRPAMDELAHATLMMTQKPRRISSGTATLARSMTMKAMRNGRAAAGARRMVGRVGVAVVRAKAGVRTMGTTH